MFIHAIASHGVRNTGSEPPQLFYVFAVDSFTDVPVPELTARHHPAPDPASRRQVLTMSPNVLHTGWAI